MFTTTTVFSLLLATTATAFPISWPRIVAREYTPTQLAQGTNYYFDSLHIESQCTPGQIACVSSNLAKCSPEGNWEISPCTGNTTCLAVPSSDNGLLVQCMLFTDAQAAIGDDSVSADQGVLEAPMNTATAVASPSATPTEDATEAAPTDAPTSTEAADPNATCTDEEPEATETQTITVILTPNPTESGAFITSTLTGDSASATGEPEPSSDAAEPTVTGTDVEEQPTATESAPAEATCTETPEEPEEGDEQPEETESEQVPIETVSGELPTEEAPTETQSGEAPVETTSTEAAAPSEGVTLTIAPGNQAPAPTGAASAPEVIVGGTHFIPAAPSASPAPAPARMMRVRRST